MSSARPVGGRRIRALAYTLVTTSIVLLFALAEWAAEGLVSARSRAAGTAIEIAIVLIAALVFRPIHQFVERSVEEAFYRKRRQALAALEKFRHELTSFSDMGELLRQFIESIERHLDTRACAVYLHRGDYHPERSTFEPTLSDLAADDPLVGQLSSSGKAARPKALRSGAPGTHAFPMRAAGELVGFVVVDCRYGEYDVEEAHELSALARDLAVAVVALDPRLRMRRARPTNVSADLAALIGREREIAEIEAALQHARLVTLTGAGGVGKTRLALECVRSAVDDREHGAWFVDLSPIRDGSLVAGSMLAAMNVSSGDAVGDVPRLIDHLQARAALVVLDNCEHIVADVIPVIRDVLAACPRITVIATSREVLHLADEHVYRVGPLEPDAASRLFEMRATAVSPGFVLAGHEPIVAEICARLDGIPLAIELAAARVRALSVADVAKRLDERLRLLTTGDRTAAPRQQTLAATIEWSYELLPPEEQSLFARLAAFRGSFSLPAATAVCPGDGNRDELHVLDILTSLADKSLVLVTPDAETRYRLLESIRAFAAERSLELQASTIVRYQHAAYFRDLAARAYHEFDSGQPEGWLERLAPDIDNLRAALDWTLDGAGDRVVGAQLAADCGPIFLRMGLLAEGLRWCESARHVEHLRPSTAGRIEYVASMMYNNLFAFSRALECAERARGYYRESSDRRGLIRALSQVAQLCSRVRRQHEVSAPAEEAIEQARALGEPRLLASVLRRCAYALPEIEIKRTRELFREAFDVATAVGDREELSRVLTWWATRESDADSLARAIELSKQALTYADSDAKLYNNSNIAGWSVASGMYDEAFAYASAAFSSAYAIGHPMMMALGLLHAAPGVSRSDPQGAALLFGYATDQLQRLDWAPEDNDLLALQRAREIISSALQGETMEELLERGAATSLDKAAEIVRAASAGRSSAGLVTTDVTGDRVGTLLRQ